MNHYKLHFGTMLGFKIHAVSSVNNSHMCYGRWLLKALFGERLETGSILIVFIHIFYVLVAIIHISTPLLTALRWHLQLVLYIPQLDRKIMSVFKAVDCLF
jgi:hypothetical protein